MDKLFNPESILVVGVSPSPRNMGRNIVHNLIRFGYAGRVYIMGRRTGNVAGQPIHTSFETIPEGIDLAVFLTPAPLLPGLVDECGKKGIKWLAVESGGFSELADDRKELEDRLLAVARKWGIRFVGPNGLGVISRAHGMVVPFMEMRVLPAPGRVSLLAQSGGVGIVYLHALGNENMGLDKFVSLGNKLSLDEADYLEHIGKAGTSDVVCLYLEDVRRGRRFFEAMRGFPGRVIIQKANVSKAGAIAARSHTASLSTDDRLVEAAVRQAGALRVQDMDSMVHFAMGLTLPPVVGNRILVLSRSGGHAVIAADFAERSGFVLPELPGEISAIAADSGRAHVIRAANPLDLGDVFDFRKYARMMEIGARGDSFDAVAVIHVFSSDFEGDDADRLCGEAVRLVKETGKPIFLCFLTDGPELERIKGTHRFPLFQSPEILMDSMAASRNHYARARRIENESFPAAQPMDLSAISSLLSRARAEAGGRVWLPAAQVFELVDYAGFPVAPYAVAMNRDEAATAGKSIGYPVVMKVLSPAMLHKSRKGGVGLNIREDGAAREEFDQLAHTLEEAAPGASLDGVLVQKMVKDIREVFLGGRQDPSFGPVVAVGFGGTLVEVLDDISVRLCPVSNGDIEEMLGEVELFRAFRDWPGGHGADFDFVRNCVARLSQLLVNFPEIDEIDLNPLKLFDQGEGGIFVDARIAIKP